MEDEWAAYQLDMAASLLLGNARAAYYDDANRTRDGKYRKTQGQIVQDIERKLLHPEEVAAVKKVSNYDRALAWGALVMTGRRA